MLRFEIKTADSVTASDISAWTSLLYDGNPAPSPYLTPDYFQAVARVRPSARLLVARENAVPVVFFPYHCGGMTGAAGLGHGIGGPISDVQGVIAGRGIQLDADQLMDATGLTLLSMAHTSAGDPVFSKAPKGAASAHAFHVMDLSDGFDVYEAERTPFAKSAFRAIRTRLVKAESQFGAVSHRFWDADTSTMDALLDWKRQQFAATGQINVLEVGWIQSLMKGLLHSQSDLRAQVSSLWFGDKLVAAHLGLRTATTLHYWFPAYDAAVQELSPGNILLYRMAQEAAREGVRQVHLGAGDYRYKQEFANCSLPMRSVSVKASNWPGWVAGTGERLVGALERLLPTALAPLPAGALRRLDRHLAFRAL